MPFLCFALFALVSCFLNSSRVRNKNLVLVVLEHFVKNCSDISWQGWHTYLHVLSFSPHTTSRDFSLKLQGAN